MIPIPKEVLQVAAVLQAAGFEAYAVGGCVRDMLLGRVPKDWDVATNAKPEQVQKLFASALIAPESKDATVYENEFGTVGVKTASEDPRLKVIEVTTYRIEGKYSDYRHPDEVKFAKTIEEDLARRDFTCNAMALKITPPASLRQPELLRKSKQAGEALRAGNYPTFAKASAGKQLPITNEYEIVDPYGGQADLEKGIIRAVGEAVERFEEDALRLLRAVRFAAELGDFSAQGGPASGWQIEPKTAQAIRERAGLLGAIAKERVRDEFVKMIMTPRAAAGVFLLEEFGLLGFILPELRESIGVSQDKHHIYGVFEHLVRSLDYAAKEGYSLEVRLASLLHDMGKPKTKRTDKTGSTFYNHEMVGARMAGRVLDRLHFSREVIEKVVHLVRYHMFYYNVGEVSPAGVRRFLVRVGVDAIDDLFQVREADRIGSGVPKAVPYKLRHFKFMIDKVRHDPISAKMLAVNGTDLMNNLNIPPSPRLGRVLAALLEEVIDDPARNVREDLLVRAQALNALTDKQLEELAAKSKEKQALVESEVEEDMKQKHRV